MNILIASGIYPPDIGGPATYAKNLFDTWNVAGHHVQVASYTWERNFPTLVRHFLYFIKIIVRLHNTDMVLVLDTWSAAIPTMYACKLLRKKYLIRTGGDFLWENYIERTGEMVLLREFYATSALHFNRKEKIVFSMTKKVLTNASHIIFSTEWQRTIFIEAYHLDASRTFIVENYCGKKGEPTQPLNRSFVASARGIKLKNINLLQQAFSEANDQLLHTDLGGIELDTDEASATLFKEKVRSSYAVILVSISEISPNMIFDAIRAGVPFIVTKENGIVERIRDCAIFVDPTSKEDIKEKIVWLSDPLHRQMQVEKIQKFNWVHTWEEIGNEIVKIYRT